MHRQTPGNSNSTATHVERRLCHPSAPTADTSACVGMYLLVGTHDCSCRHRLQDQRRRLLAGDAGWIAKPVAIAAHTPFGRRRWLRTAVVPPISVRQPNQAQNARCPFRALALRLTRFPCFRLCRSKRPQTGVSARARGLYVALLPAAGSDLVIQRQKTISQTIYLAGDLCLPPGYRTMTNNSTTCPSPPTTAAEPRRSQTAKRKRIPIVAIDYHTAAVAGSSNVRPRLLGLTYQVPGRNPQRVSANGSIAEALHALGDRRRVYANALHARSVEQQAGLPLADRFDDVSIMARLLDEDWPRDLSELATTLLDDQSQSKKRQTVEAVLDLCSEAKLRRRVHDEGLDAVYQLELDVIDPTVAMMHNGMRVDTDCLNKMATEFDQLAASSQDKLARQYAGLRDTAKRLLRFVDPGTGRIHCSLGPAGHADRQVQHVAIRRCRRCRRS